MDFNQPSLQSLPRPLFDKLHDEDPASEVESIVLKSYTMTQLQDSIMDEVGKILNTRSNLTLYRKDQFDDLLKASPLFYGTIDVLSIREAGQHAWRRLGQEFSKSIARFEPRLKKITVSVITFNETNKELKLSITGLISCNDVDAPISFESSIEEFALGSELTPFKTVR